MLREGDADDGAIRLVLHPHDLGLAKAPLVGDADVELFTDVNPIFDHGAEASAADVERPARDFDRPSEELEAVTDAVPCAGGTAGRREARNRHTNRRRQATSFTHRFAGEPSTSPQGVGFALGSPLRWCFVGMKVPGRA